jgi:hypothetical protein
MKLIIETHYAKDDPEFYYDYFSMIVKDVSGNIIMALGDYYHDKSSDVINGFIKGVEWATDEKLEVESIKIADEDY